MLCGRENEIDVVLFGQCAADACLEQAQSCDNDEPVVAIINLARVSWTADSKED